VPLGYLCSAVCLRVYLSVYRPRRFALVRAVPASHTSHGLEWAKQVLFQLSYSPEC